MNILHYSLGVFPYRSGGMTRYVEDLAAEQKEMNNSVALLYPGGCSYPFNIIKIVKKKHRLFSLYEIVNAIPVPLFYGIRDISIINDSKLEISDFESFVLQFKPDIFHIHTLMGISPRLLHFLKSHNIIIVYTSHDYFGLCSKVNFINNGELCTKRSVLECALCNINALSSFWLRLRSSPILAQIKNRFPRQPINQVLMTKKKTNRVMQDDYKLIFEYYEELFSLVDFFHFNSTVSKQVYESYLQIKDSIIIPVSHKAVVDRRKKIKFNSNLRIGFIGSHMPYKGLYMLLNVLTNLTKQNINGWEFNVWGCSAFVKETTAQVKWRGKYTTSDLDAVYESMDLLVVPSLWPETFSLITLEALSFGIPVLVSQTVGAKDIVENISSFFIFQSEKDLEEKIKSILSDRYILEKNNREICSINWRYSMREHALEMNRVYKSLISNYNNDR